MTDRLETHIPCEVCGSSDAKCIYEDGHGYCFSCETYFKPANDFSEMGGEVAEPINYTYEYLGWRGVTKDTFQFFDCKTKIDPSGKPLAIGYRYPNGAHQVRYLDSKEFYWDKSEETSKPGLFGKDKFSPGSHKYVTITEGALDACSFWQVLKAPVVSVRSSSSAVSDVTVDRSWLNEYERIYLAFDGDAAGKEAASKVARLFDFNKVYLVRFDKRKDANEYLQHGEADQLRQLWWNSKKYIPESIINTFDEFKRILKEEKKPGIPYPFPSWNKMMYGIRTSESVLITAQEGVGKTAVMHALEHQILKETDANVGSIFLEEPKRDHIQALASIELGKPVHLPDAGVSDDDAFAGFEKVVGVDERFHMYSHFGSDDPEVLLDLIRFLVSARSCRYILLDHITMAVSGLAGDKIRTALDYFITRLEMMLVELDFALLFVSHINDNGDTRDSRMISKVANTHIRLERDGENTDPILANTTTVTVKKNRFGQKLGKCEPLIFDPLTCRYYERPPFGEEHGPEERQRQLSESKSSDLQMVESPTLQWERSEEEKDKAYS